MAESTLALTYAQLRRIIGRKLGYGRDPASPAWSSDKVTDVDDAMISGLCRFYGSHNWSFLKIPIEVPTYAVYSTGTIAITAGVVTLTGGTFPSWAADGDIRSTIAYRVASRDSNTQCTLVDTSVNVTAGASYQLVNARYTLPDDFAGFIDDHLTYRPGDAYWPTKVQITYPERIRDMRFRSMDYTDRPRFAAVQAKAAAGTSAGQRSELAFYPLPAFATRLQGLYRPLTSALTSSIIYPYGGALHRQTIIAVCLDEALNMQPGFNYDGRYGEQYKALLQESKRIDAETYSPKTLGLDRGATLNWFGEDAPEDQVVPLRNLPNLDL